MQNNEIRIVQKEILKDIESLVEIPSVPEKETVAENAPFGAPIRCAFDKFKEIAQQKGFEVEDDDGYAISAQIGKGEEYIGVLAHLDVVEAGDATLWNYPPYHMTEKDGMFYGRGVNDDKGPLVAALYAAYIIKQQQLPLKYPIRIIAGGAEETTWECMHHYFKTHPQPLLAFSPDGNFPIVNGEKGILQVQFLFPTTQGVRMQSKERLNYVCDELQVFDTIYKSAAFNEDESYKTQQEQHAIYRGTRALSRNPQRGDNAIYKFVKDYKELPLTGSLKDCVRMLDEQFCDDYYGKKSGCYAEDKEMGTTSVCAMSLRCDEELFEVCIDIRYVKSIKEETLVQRLHEIANIYHAKLEIIKKKKLLFVDENSILIQGLKKAYKKVMKEEAAVLTKGGASYARVLDHGVAFGATFPDEDPRPHMPNECMPVASLLKACEIYYEALYELAVDQDKLKID